MYLYFAPPMAVPPLRVVDLVAIAVGDRFTKAAGFDPSSSFAAVHYRLSPVIKWSDLTPDLLHPWWFPHFHFRPIFQHLPQQFRLHHFDQGLSTHLLYLSHLLS